jgi:hypothetical protein
MPNGNQRGNTYDRRVRKQWLLTKFGDGEKAPCHECAAMVTITTIVVDRITPYVDGGTYRRNNIRVHCHDCSNKQGPMIRSARKAKNMNSREIIWQHAKEYRWTGLSSFGGNPRLDRFTRHGIEIIVRYGKSGRVTGAMQRVGMQTQSLTLLAPANRNTIMDELESWAK